MNRYIATRLARHILDHPNYPWNWTRLSLHPHLTTDVIDTFPDKPWDWFNISTTIPLWYVLNHPEIPWNWTQLTLSPKITIQEMMEHRDLPWDLSNLGFTTITFDDVPFLRCFYDKLTYDDWVDHTTHAEWDAIRKSLDLPWKAAHIHFHIGDIETEDDIEALKRFEIQHLNWENLSIITNIRLIRKYHDLPWVMDLVARNRCIKWFDNIPGMDLHVVPLEPVYRIRVRWNAAVVIQKQWFKSTIDPKYALCRKLVNKFITEFHVPGEA